MTKPTQMLVNLRIQTWLELGQVEETVSQLIALAKLILHIKAILIMKIFYLWIWKVMMFGQVHMTTYITLM